MTIFHLVEENLDISFEEIKTSAEIKVDALDVNIYDLTSDTEILPGSLKVIIEEKVLEAKIVEEHLNINLQEVMILPSVSEGSGKVKRNFTFADFVGSELQIGNIPDGSDVIETILEFFDPFDGDIQMSVGTSVSQALLMRIDENLPNVSGRYCITNNLEVNGMENFRLFFSQAVPSTIGSGRITIYYH
jgi:hypothetical protein